MLTVDFDRLQLRPGDKLLDMGCGGGRHAFAAMKRGASVLALDYSEADLKDVRATVGAMLDAGEIPASLPWLTVNGDALRLPVPRRVDRPHRVLRGARAHLGLPRRDHRARARAQAGRPHGGDDPHPLARAGQLGARPRVPRRARRARAHLPPARARAGPRGRRAVAPRLAPRARAPLAVLVDPLHGRREPARPPGREALPRLPRVAAHQESEVARGRRPGTEPGHGQEPRDLHAEGGPVDRRRGLRARRARWQTVDAIASVQLPDGNIPWIPGGHTDPWNLVEAALALDVGGRHAEAARAYEWLRSMQNPDGSWHAYYVGNDVKDPTLDTNVACYLATGVWHHYLSHRRHRVPPRVLADRRADHRLRARLPDRDRRDRVAGRRPGRRRAAHRVVEHPPQPALRDRDRRAPRPRPPRLGAVGRRAGHRDRPPARALPRQGPLGDGLVLPDPRWRAPRPGRADAHRRVLGHVRGPRPRRALRLGPAVGDRGRDVRARDGARRDRRDRARARSCSAGSSSCVTTTARTGAA